MNDITEILANFKKRHSFTVPELSVILFGAPKRTLEDWLSGRREPPEYITNLINEQLIHVEEALKELPESREAIRKAAQGKPLD